jgi:glucose/mannose-6-phosphate isomerase
VSVDERKGEPAEPSKEPLDSLGMAARIAAIPDQIERAVEEAAAHPWKLPVPDPDLLATGALGGSAISTDLAAAALLDRLPRPVLTVREYHWPACVTRRSLALLSSFSGNTEETLALYEEAGTRGVPRIVLTTGGALAEHAARDGVHARRMPPGGSPRAAIYGSWVAVTDLFHALGWIANPAGEWREAVQLLRVRNVSLGPDVPIARNPARRLAHAIGERPVYVYAASERLGPVATRIRNQINENAKLLGHSALVPELNHNEIVGWEMPGTIGRDAVVLILRDAEDAPEADLRLTLTADYVKQRGAEVVEVREAEGQRLARLAAHCQFGDYLSLYLALLRGTDPTPIASIDWFKQKLAERKARA